MSLVTETCITKQVAFIRRDYETNDKTEIVYTSGKVNYVDEDPDAVLNFSLQLLGSDIKARRKMAKTHLNIMQFIPIIIDADSGLAFFPLHRQSDYCKYYISSLHFLSVMSEDLTIIKFTTNQAIIVSQTPFFIRKQYERTLMMIDTQKKIREHHLNYELV